MRDCSDHDVHSNATLQALLNALVVLCATNWVVLKSSEDAFDPFTFALLRLDRILVLLSTRPNCRADALGYLHS